MADIWMDVDAALAEVPVNVMPLVDDTDFKTIEDSVAYNAAGMDLNWNFVTTAGAFTQTNVTPTTAGVHDWTSQTNGMYTIEIPATSGTINNDTEGFGWFSGVATGILPWRGPTIGFRAAGINNALIDSAYSATRGLAGTALPDAAADAAGGVPISDAGGLDIDAMNTNVSSVLTDTGTAGVLLATDALDSDALAATAVTKIMASVVESEGNYTVQQALSILLSALAGVTSNGGATLETPNGNANRIVATVNGSNERTAVTLTPSS